MGLVAEVPLATEVLLVTGGPLATRVLLAIGAAALAALIDPLQEDETVGVIRHPRRLKRWY